MPNIPNNELITHRPKSMCLNLQNHPIFKITVAIVVQFLTFEIHRLCHEKVYLILGTYLLLSSLYDFIFMIAGDGFVLSLDDTDSRKA